MEGEKSSEEKETYKVTITGSIVNFFLLVLKSSAGIIGHGTAMLTDVIHSLSDLVTDTVVIVFVRIAEEPEGKGYDYGHGKYETLVTAIIGLLFLCVGFGIFWNGASSIYAFLQGRQLEPPGIVALVAALVSIVSKEIPCQYTVIQGRKLDPQAMVANAWHHRSDALSSIGTVISIGGVILLGDHWRVFDPIAVVVVSFFIMEVSVQLLTPRVGELFEKSLPDDVEKGIEQTVLSFPGASQPHRLHTCRIGSYYVIEIHVHMGGKITLEEAYGTTAAIENKLKEMSGKGTHVGIHMEPTKQLSFDLNLMESILVIGAGEFIGNFIVQKTLKREFSVWAGIRAPSSKGYLRGHKIHFFELDFAHPNELRAQLSGYEGAYNRFDYIVHCVGVAKRADRNGFSRINYLQTKYLIDTSCELNIIPKQFIYIGTLGVFGPVHEKDYSPIREGDIPVPNATYGLSKLKARLYIQSTSDFPYAIYRPTEVYGPREIDYSLMAKSVRQHMDFSVGYKRQDLTSIYMEGIAQVIFLGTEKEASRHACFLADGGAYKSRALSDLIQKELGSPFVIHIKYPLIALEVVSLLAEFIATRSGKGSTLNSGKYKMMKQRNWQYDITPAVRELGYVPECDLGKGVKETIAWYKNEGWLQTYLNVQKAVKACLLLRRQY